MRATGYLLISQPIRTCLSVKRKGERDPELPTMATENKEYTKEDMVRDFLNPAEYMSASDLVAKGNLTVMSVNAMESEKYGKSYAVTFDTEDGTTVLSYISAKHPYAIFEEYGVNLVGSVVVFNKISTKDGKNILKMRLVSASDSLKALI